MKAWGRAGDAGEILRQAQIVGAKYTYCVFVLRNEKLRIVALLLLFHAKQASRGLGTTERFFVALRMTRRGNGAAGK